MTTNIVELLQKNLGYPVLHQIDPNTQEEVRDKNNPTHTLAQAAITSVAIGFYEYSRDKDLAEIIKAGNVPTNWLDALFENKKNEVISKVAEYGNVNIDEAQLEMEKVADETMKVINDNTKGINAHSYLTMQRSNILTYLPEALQMGDIFNDTTIDDRTNKMKGPISSLMHTIEQAFTDTEIGKGAIEETFASKDKMKE